VSGNLDVDGGVTLNGPLTVVGGPVTLPGNYLHACTTVSNCFNGCGGSATPPNVAAACPAGKVVVSGGCSDATGTGQLVEATYSNANGWRCRWSNQDLNCGCATALCCGD
jgi:hypothetical protein